MDAVLRVEAASLRCINGHTIRTTAIHLDGIVGCCFLNGGDNNQPEYSKRRYKSDDNCCFVHWLLVDRYL